MSVIKVSSVNLLAAFVKGIVHREFMWTAHAGGGGGGGGG